MERNSKRIQRVSEAGNTSLRNAAAKFVAARFNAKSHAAIPSKGASRIAGYSTVTVSGASSAGLDRCAYTLGKWKNSAQPAVLAARKQSENDISRQFPGIERQLAARTVNKPVTEQHPENSSGVQGHDSVASFENYTKRADRETAADSLTDGVTDGVADEKSAIAVAEQQGIAEQLANPVTSELATATDVARVSSYADNKYIGEERRLANDRRNYTIKTLLHCFKNPQRATGRRKSDKRYPLLDVFDASAMFLAVALTTLSLCDAFFTLNILAHGGQEVNPFMNYMLGYGTFAFVASKMLFTAVAVVVMTGAGNLLLFNRIRVRSILAILIGLYAGLIAYELSILAIV